MSEIKHTILVIDDEKQIRRFLNITLSAAGYKVEEASTGKEGSRMAASIKPDMIICDLGLPDMDGMDVIRDIRKHSKSPIIVLSIRSESKDIVQALDLGADDYLVKPFNTEILLARLRANLRKAIKADGGDSIMEVGNLRMDVMKHEITNNGTPINLSPKEFKLLKYFMTNAGKMIVHSQLLNEIWGSAHEENIQYLRIYIGQLRQKIEPDPAHPRIIITESGVGYRMEKTAQ